MLDNECVFFLVGGEPTLLSEFSKILKFIQKYNYSINILSNGILYEKEISKTIKRTKSFLSISLDCASSDLFKRIKRVDKFNEVIKNIKRYIKESGENSNKVIIKYIILEGVNDNKEEINKFIELCEKLGVRNIMPSIEFCHSYTDEKKRIISEHICELYNFMKVSAKEYNKDFIISTYDFVEKMVENRLYKN